MNLVPVSPSIKWSDISYAAESQVRTRWISAGSMLSKGPGTAKIISIEAPVAITWSSAPAPPSVKRLRLLLLLLPCPLRHAPSSEDKRAPHLAHTEGDLWMPLRAGGAHFQVWKLRPSEGKGPASLNQRRGLGWAKNGNSNRCSITELLKVLQGSDWRIQQRSIAALPFISLHNSHLTPH